MPNRVQFQKGLSSPEFMNRYRETEEQCGQAVTAARWPCGFVCPVCGVMQSRDDVSPGGSVVLAVRGLPVPVVPVQRQQRHCLRGHQAAPLTRWFLAMQLLTRAQNSRLGAGADAPARAVSYRTAWLMTHKLLQALALAASPPGSSAAGWSSTTPTSAASAAAAARPAAGLAGTRCRSSWPCRPAGLTWRVPVGQALREGHDAGVRPRQHGPAADDGLRTAWAASPWPPRWARRARPGARRQAARPAFSGEQLRAVNTLIDNVKTALTGTPPRPSSFASTAAATSPRSSSASTGATTCAPCSAACCGPSSLLRSSLSAESGLLRFIANQVQH